MKSCVVVSQSHHGTCVLPSDVVSTVLGSPHLQRTAERHSTNLRYEALSSISMVHVSCHSGVAIYIAIIKKKDKGHCNWYVFSHHTTQVIYTPAITTYYHRCCHWVWNVDLEINTNLFSLIVKIISRLIYSKNMYFSCSPYVPQMTSDQSSIHNHSCFNTNTLSSGCHT